MRAYLRQYSQQGQAAVLLALAMIGLLAIVGLALDGGMLYWNQRRAQNGADAAVIAGVTAMVDDFLADGTVCGPEQAILDRVYEYASVNEVPDAGGGNNVEAFYLTKNNNGDRVLLINPATNKPWKVGGGGANIPCNQNIAGLQVRASFPQQTFLAGIIGIAESNVTVQASAEWVYGGGWCSDFVIYAIEPNPDDPDVLKVAGSKAFIHGGGIHSGGSIHLQTETDFIPDNVVIEYAPGAKHIDKIWENIKDPDPVGKAVPYEKLPDDFFYKWEDFVGPSGRFYLDAQRDGIPVYYFTRDIDKDDVKNAQGLKPGLYVTTGAVKLSNVDPGRDSGNIGSTDKPWQVTFAALGQIHISGGINQVPAVPGIFVFSDSNDMNNGAIQLSGSNNNMTGLVMAPHGLVNFSGSFNGNMNGQIVGWRVNIQGSEAHFVHDNSLCPYTLPRVLLIQ